MNPTSLSLLDLAGPRRDVLLHVCLDEHDLRALGFQLNDEAGCTLTRRTLRWSRLHRELEGPRAAALARRVADLLDLRHLELVLEVRGACAGQLVRRVERAAGTTDRRDHEGLLWALSTDPRDCAQRIGHLLGSELYHVRLQRTTAPESAGERGAPRSRRAEPGGAA